MIDDLSNCSLEDLEEFFSFNKIDKMRDVDLGDGVGYDEETGEYFPVDSFKRRLTEQEIKDRKLQLKRMVIAREQELGVIYDEKALPELLGMGHYRENKGYNKYNEWCCNKCHQYKPRTVNYYPKDRQRTDGLGYTCRECLKSYSKEYYQKKREKKEEKENKQNGIRWD